jgi:hypothetical protein
MIQIEWKDIDGYPLYEVSDCGYVRNKETGKILIPSRNSRGYLQVYLYNNGKRRWHRIHRIVASVFHDNFEQCAVVNHSDGDKLNNRADNLEWMSQADNVRHYHRTKTKQHDTF